MVLFKSSSSLTRCLTKSRSHQTFSESLMADTIQAAEAIITRWISPDLPDSSPSSSPSSSSSFCTLSSLFSPGNRQEARRFIGIATSLHYAMQSVASVNPRSKKLDRAKNLIRIAMEYLEREFYRILKSNRRYLDPESVSVRSSLASDSKTSWRSSRSVSDSELDSSNSVVSKSESEDADAMADLKMIADCMIYCGYYKECEKIYKKIRKSVMVEALDRLGFENMSLAQIQKLEGEVVENKIKKWLCTARVAVTTLFYAERILCDHVFSSSSIISESCFAEITLESALALFGFPESVAKCRLSPEKIFLMLDVYQAISNLMLQIELVFSYDSTATVRSRAVESQSKLGEAVRSMIGDFETSISMESSKSPIPGGGVHQLARYVMNFVAFLADYTDSLAGILTTESVVALPEDFFGGGGGEETAGTVVYSTVATKLAWLILVLLCKIDTKSRLYSDVALSYLFLANNLHYIVVKVRTSNLRVVLGEDWVRKHEKKVRQYVSKCEKIAWGNVMTSLSGDTAEEEWLRRFNEAFEEAYKKQSSWVVPDPKLRDEIKVSAAGKLIPAYSELCKRWRVGSRENVRYAPEDLGNYLSDLYSGSEVCINSSDSNGFRR